MNALAAPFAELAADTPVAIAFSGGRDSTVLLHALAAARPRVRAIHVQHDLSPQAPVWAERAQGFARRLGLVCTVRTVSARGATSTLGPEAAARNARYAALADALAPGEVLATAQHAGDQAETFLMQALRGAGLAGLAAMPAWAAFGHGWLWRPWLDVSSAAIARYIEAEKLAPIVDPSNRDPGLARGFLRRRVWPELVAGWPAAEATLARAAGWAAEANEAIATLAAIDLARARAAGNSLSAAVLAELSPARRAPVVRRWLAELGLNAPDHRHVAQIDALRAACAHNSPRVVFARTEVRAFDARLFAMPRLSAPPAGNFEWDGASRLLLPGDAGTLYGDVPAAAALRVGFRCGGERVMRPDGSSKRLADWLRERRVPPWVRERLPLVFAGDTLIAVADVWQHPRIVRWFERDTPAIVWDCALIARPAALPGCRGSASMHG